MTATMRHDIEEVSFHLVLYRRLATYHKFLIDRYESLCDYFAGRNRASTLVMNIFFENFKRQGSLFVKHSCPYRANETVTIFSPRYPFKLFESPLLPSGAYRAHVIYTSGPGPRSAIFMEFIVFFSISDHRVWQ